MVALKYPYNSGYTPLDRAAFKFEDNLIKSVKM